MATAAELFDAELESLGGSVHRLRNDDIIPEDVCIAEAFIVERGERFEVRKEVALGNCFSTLVFGPFDTETEAEEFVDQANEVFQEHDGIVVDYSPGGAGLPGRLIQGADDQVMPALHEA